MKHLLELFLSTPSPFQDLNIYTKPYRPGHQWYTTGGSTFGLRLRLASCEKHLTHSRRCEDFGQGVWTDALHRCSGCPSLRMKHKLRLFHVTVCYDDNQVTQMGLIAKSPSQVWSPATLAILTENDVVRVPGSLVLFSDSPKI